MYDVSRLASLLNAILPLAAPSFGPVYFLSFEFTVSHMDTVPTMPHIDFQNAVLNTIGTMTRATGSIDQCMLRRLLMLTPAYLLVDNTIISEGGLTRWSAGFNRIVDILLALHAKEELELATVNEASKACSECWSVSGTYRGLTAEGRSVVRGIAGRLKTILDRDGKKYRGQRVYAP